MVLSNQEIWDEFAYSEFDIYPLTVEQVQPASVDLRLGRDFKVFTQKPDKDYFIDSKHDIPKHYYNEKENVSSILIKPGNFYLGTTMETINMPAHLYAEVKGRSSVGRLGVEVHKTAGVIDPGWRGEITLEITTDMPHPVKLYAGQRVAQMTVVKLDKPADPAYGEKADSKYQNQSGPTPSRIAYDES